MHKNQKITDAQVDQADVLHSQGFTWKEIANELGVDESTLRRRRRQLKINADGLTLKAQSFDENGMLLGEKFGLVRDDNVDVSGMEVVGVSTGPNGGSWVKYAQPKDSTVEETYFSDFLEEVKAYAPKYQKIERNNSDDEGKLLVIDIADIHVGKYASKESCDRECNIELSVSRAMEAFESIVKQGTGHNIDQILLIIGNDVLHVDSEENKTTRGTRQDTDGTIREMAKAAEKMYIDMIEKLLPIADVHVMHNGSNHDLSSGWHLAQTVHAWFHNAENITWDIDGQYRKYFRYGKSLIGSTHGDGIKENNLVEMMHKDNSKISIHTCPYRYFYCHHMHHKIAKDHINVTIEYVRSTSTDDVWHNRGGYMGKPAGEGFLHSKTTGQIARLTHYV